MHAAAPTFLHRLLIAPHRYSYEYEPCEGEEGTLHLKIKANCMCQHGGLINYTPYLKRSAVEQLSHAVDLLQKQFPVDANAKSAAPLDHGDVLVRGEKLLSDVTPKPALTVRGVVQNHATAVACAVGRPVV